MAHKLSGQMVIVILGTLLLTACTGEAANNKIEVTAADSVFTPTEWTVSANQPLTVTLTNRGTMHHKWIIMAKGWRATVPFGTVDEYRTYWEIGAAPGGTRAVTFTAPNEPGEYEVVCSAAGQLEKGMRARLIVK